MTGAAGVGWGAGGPSGIHRMADRGMFRQRIFRPRSPIECLRKSGKTAPHSADASCGPRGRSGSALAFRVNCRPKELTNQRSCWHFRTGSMSGGAASASDPEFVASVVGKGVSVMRFCSSHAHGSGLRLVLALTLSAFAVLLGAAFGLEAQPAAPGGDFQWRALGARTYDNNCSGCHQRSGRGIAGGFPPLAGHASEVLAQKGSGFIARLVLFG